MMDKRAASDGNRPSSRLEAEDEPDKDAHKVESMVASWALYYGLRTLKAPLIPSFPHDQRSGTDAAAHVAVDGVRSMDDESTDAPTSSEVWSRCDRFRGYLCRRHESNRRHLHFS